MASFLIRRLDEKVRKSLEREAKRQKLPIQEVVRQILCRHYELDCDPTPGWQRRDAWDDATTIFLKNIDQDVFDALKADSATSGESMQVLVHQALDAHFSSRR